MGHTRLGTIPKTVRWNNVVALIVGGNGSGNSSGNDAPLTDDVDEVARLSLIAAEFGLQEAIKDDGLRFAFYLLTQVALSTRTDDWQSELGKIGITLPADPTPFDLTVEIQANLDDYLTKQGRVSDFSEMAQQAVGESLISLTASESNTLFGNDLYPALRALSTKNGFADLGQRFFARFMYRFLNFYLCRVTAKSTGRSRIEDVTTLNQFNRTLAHHCEQSALIVHDFCGSWYSKTNFEGGINMNNTSAFMATALKKLRRELKRQGEGQ